MNLAFSKTFNLFSSFILNVDIFNLGNKDVITVNEIAKIIIEEMNLKKM